ncbi:MAG: SAM-dependent methyltransferase, partial [Pseudomonadota bacterium]
LLFARADLIDFWRQIDHARLGVAKNYLLYPNPWPKPGHLQRRWHGHPVFPTLATLSSELILRTNWEIYAQEFYAALNFLISLGRLQGTSDFRLICPESPISRFEKKYLESDHQLFEVVFSKERK